MKIVKGIRKVKVLKGFQNLVDSGFPLMDKKWMNFEPLELENGWDFIAGSDCLLMLERKLTEQHVSLDASTVINLFDKKEWEERWPKIRTSLTEEQIQWVLTHKEKVKLREIL